MSEMQELGAACGISVKGRKRAAEDWISAVTRMSYVPVVYTNASIEYQSAYQRGHGGSWEDLSVVVELDGRPVAVWPLSRSELDGVRMLSSHGLPVAPPLFTADCPLSSAKRIARSCLTMAEQLAASAGISGWTSAESFNESVGLSEWHIAAMSHGATCTVTHELYVDLRQDLAVIRGNIRKSYKPLISRGIKTWKVEVLSYPDETVWDEFRRLHLHVSGRETRSAETWALQLGDIGPDGAILVYLRDEAGVMVGGGLFTLTMDEGLYAVGAYERSLFDKPLGHVVQARAIEELKRRGVRWYKIGARPYASDVPAPSQKEISIAEFKQGFASHVMPRFHLIHA